MKKAIITGNLGRDPERRVDQSGNQFATFSVAVSVGTKQNPKTDWVKVSCNGKLVDIVCNYIRKGSKVLVMGYPSVNVYMNKDNNPVGELQIYAREIEFLNKLSDDNVITSNLPTSNSDEEVAAMVDDFKSDEVPF